MEGYFKLNRKFFKHSFWLEERTFSPAEAWLDLMASARFKSGHEKLLVNMKTIVINRGELRASQRFLATRWRWSVGRVNRFIKLLETETMITRRNEHNETIITILNYNKFNPLDISPLNTNGNTNGMQGSNTNGTPTDTLPEHQQTQTKELKERIKKEEEILYRQKFFQVLEIFYFKNFKSPITVTKAFFAHYEGIGWVNGNGNPITNIVAVAEKWKNTTTEGQNAPAAILIQWWKMFNLVKYETDQYTNLLLIRPAKLQAGILIVRGKESVIRNDIEGNPKLMQVFRKAFREVFAQTKIKYEIDKPTLEEQLTEPRIV